MCELAIYSCMVPTETLRQKKTNITIFVNHSLGLQNEGVVKGTSDELKWARSK
jgi:hypothetical protein